MDFETLERLWRSEANDRATVAETYVLETTMKTLKHRRNAFANGMGLIGLALVIWTGAVAYAVIAGKIADLTKEWGIVVLLAISWLAFLWAQARQRQHTQAFPDAASMPEALSALIDENRTAQARTRMMGVALLVFAAALTVSVWQLYSVGKMEWRHVLQGSVRYFRFQKPEGERLQRLLAEYAQD